MTTPNQPAEELVHNLGDQVLDLAVDLAPLAVPFVLAMTAIAWVLSKFGVSGRIDNFAVKNTYGRGNVLMWEGGDTPPSYRQIKRMEEEDGGPSPESRALRQERKLYNAWRKDERDG